MVTTFLGRPRSIVALAAVALFAAIGLAHAQTGVTGAGQPFSNYQPSLSVTQAVVATGIYPTSGGSGAASGGMLGFIYPFAGNFAPPGSSTAQAQTLAIASNAALFSLLGINFGGNGTTVFNLPDLADRAAMGTGQGAGLTSRTLGASVGSATTTLLTSQLPSHTHSWPGGGSTGATGGGLSFDNVQPSLPLTRVIATNAAFPSPGSGGGSAAFLGQVATFAGNFTPDGWTPADGRLLPIAANAALFSVIGTRYGGDGVTTFALPDLRGRISVGADATHPLGTQFGEESTTLTTANMAAHDHAIPGGGVTGSTGSGTPVGNEQPSLALNYLIATQGLYPTGSGFDPSAPLLGQVAEFASNYEPSGWAFANGQLLPIAANAALFSILGTTYGGDGVTTFALPDLRGRTLVGTSVINPVGTVTGAASTTLTVANLALHSHSLPLVPAITSATYDAATGALVVTGTDFVANASGLDIDATKFTLTGEGGATYTLTGTPSVEISSATAFTLALSAADKAAVNQIMNKNGTASAGGAVYNLAAAEDWDTGADPALTIADLSGNGITVSSVPAPAIAVANYDAVTGTLVVTGSGFLQLAGASNDIVASKFTLTGEGSATYTLTDTPNADITSGTAFTLILSATDKAATNLILNKNGIASSGGTVYNLAANEDWAAGADAAVVVADLTGNSITVSGTTPMTFTVTPSASAGGTIAPATPQSVVSGGTTTFTVTPNPGYLANVGGTCGGTLVGNTYTTTAIVANCTVVATFVTYTPAVVVTPSAGAGGSIAPSTPVIITYGATVTFTITPSPNFSAAVGGTCGGTLVGNTYTTNPVTASCTVSASFSATPSTTYTGLSATGNGTIIASFTGGGASCGFSGAAFIPVYGAPRSPPAGSAPAGMTFPDGLFDFATSGCTPGATLAFTITYPQPLPPGTAYWKYGPTPSDASPHWYALPAVVTGNTVTFSITDGAMGDDDLAANGAIVDQGGPGVPGAPAAAAVPTLSEWALMLLAALLPLSAMVSRGTSRASVRRR